MVMVVVAALAACSDSTSPTPVDPPTAALIAHTGSATGPAILGCGPEMPYTATRSVGVTGSISDYANGSAVAGPQISFYTDPTFATAIGQTVPGTSAGKYTVTFPAGTSEPLSAKVTAPGYLDTFYGHLRPNFAGAVASLSMPTATADFIAMIYGLVRVTQDPNKATINSGLNDCQGATIEHAIAVASSQSGKRVPIAGAEIFYGVAGNLPVPVLHSIRVDTNDNGVAGFFNVPAGSFYLQFWGFPDDTAVARGDAGLVLITEEHVTVTAGELLGYGVIAQ